MLGNQLTQSYYNSGYFPPSPEENKEKNFKHKKSKIIQFADPNKTLPDGSKVVYAENDEKITLYKKIPAQPGLVYVYLRHTGEIYVNGKKGDMEDQRKMLQIGKYLLDNGRESDMVTITLS
ncbi:MAG: hypothetical protein DKM50_07280 [Candidatus Margulisiibacteriota bacterium]|nr:MAG: hypothetical protein A2X43_12780 [Candidatus Margulisbacteria bacterium GWD2_39_127]OGI02105.1 MAG: hypothetical protein A2X42_01395 [Candidatus Margulisbacteria bacterium GWF2_38_17]OGI10482.1 MAG: hypothetical protein A2X41_06895 [Candidatus Margulisbacteria bacterium GWE2_39_32]PZM79972.1 MAG: hypothetical protein DKM50_07280 [Candidatus Margulisiibacteriota bacterium]HAR62438.1 hypothetical protein [Candidatus Margulisiibacteriota bacterium]